MRLIASTVKTAAMFSHLLRTRVTAHVGVLTQNRPDKRWPIMNPNPSLTTVGFEATVGNLTC